MKLKHFYLITLIFFITSCASSTYFQLYKAESESVRLDSDGMFFENEDVKVVYNFWDDAGNSSFLLFNKTNSDIYVDLKKSHLILNGIAHTYFQNRSFSESSSSNFTVGGTTTSGYYKGISNYLINSFYDNSSESSFYTGNTSSILSYITSGSKSTVSEGYAVTTIEKDVVCVPPQSAKPFTGFSLKNSLFRDCDLLRFPSKKEITSKTFDAESSPLIFKNIIAYGFEETEEDRYKKVETDFWVSEITNYPKEKFIESKYPEFCGEKSDYRLNYYIYDQPDRFFIKYEKGTTTVFDH